MTTDKSTMNYKWKPYQAGMNFSLLACGIAFLLAALVMPIMPPEAYGEEITAIAAEIWSIGVMTASTMALWGIYKNGRSRWSPLWRVGGYTLHVVIFMLFATKAAATIFGLYLTIYATIHFTTHMLFFIWVNIGDVRNVFRS